MAAIDVVQSVLRAYAAGDREDLAALLSPEVEWHGSGPEPLGVELRGRASVLEHLLGEDHLEDSSMEVHDLLASSTRVAMLATTRGRLGTLRVVNDFVNVIEVGDDGLVAQVHSYVWDQQGVAALIAAGSA